MLLLKNPPANAGDIRDVGSIPGSERSSGGSNGNPLQHSCLENPMDRGGWWATVHRVTKSLTWLKRLSMHTHTHMNIHTLLWMLKYPKMTVGTGVGRKIMSQISMLSINERRGWWSIDGREEKARAHWIRGLEESNYKEQEEGKLLTPEKLLFLSGLQAGGRESIQHRQVQTVEWRVHQGINRTRKQVWRRWAMAQEPELTSQPMTEDNWYKDGKCGWRWPVF